VLALVLIVGTPLICISKVKMVETAHAGLVGELQEIQPDALKEAVDKVQTD
jgi:hypothetical protein